MASKHLVFKGSSFAPGRRLVQVVQTVQIDQTPTSVPHVAEEDEEGGLNLEL
jgi:hypothetical protein